MKEKNFTKVSKYFETHFPLKNHGLDELLSLLELRHYKKGNLLLESDSIEKQLRFLNKGHIRVFYYNDEKEVNINFYVKPQFITDLQPFHQHSKTKKNQEGLTDVEVLSIERQKFYTLLEKYECGKSLIDQSFQKLLKQKELNEFNRSTKTPKEIYQDLFMYKLQWLQSIPQYHIASFLNITPETLSRIRKSIS